MLFSDPTAQNSRLIIVHSYKNSELQIKGLKNIFFSNYSCKFLNPNSNSNNCNLSHRRRKYGDSSPNSLRPISYFGSIWELYVLGPNTNVFCRKKIQLHFPMNKGLTMPKQCRQFGWKQQKCLPKFQPNLSAQAQKFRIFEKKPSLGVHCPWVQDRNSMPNWRTINHSTTLQTHNETQ